MILSLFIIGCALTGTWAWFFRGWYDRRMRPTVEISDAPSRISKRWVESLATIKEPLS